MASKAIIIFDEKKKYANIFQVKDLILITSYLLCICFRPHGLKAEAMQILFP